MPTLELDMPFSGGIDEKTHPELVEPGSALSVTNLVQQQSGAYQKRNGNLSLGAPVDLAGNSLFPQRLLGYKDELLATDAVSLYSHVPQLAKWKKVPGRMPPATISTQATLSLPADVGAYDCVYQNGYHAIAYTAKLQASTWAIYGALVDAVTGTIILPNTIIADYAGSNAVPPVLTVIAVGSRAYLIWGLDGTRGGDIWCSYVDTAASLGINTGWSAPAKLINGDAFTVGGTAVTFDACSLNASSFALAYTNKSGTANCLTVNTYGSTGTLLQTQSAIGGTVVFGGIPRSISIDGNDTDVLWVAFHYNDTSAIWVIGLNPSTLAVNVLTGGAALMTGGPFETLAVTRTGTQTGMLIGCADTDSETFMATNFNVVAGTVAPISKPLVSLRINLESRPFAISSHWYCLARPRAASVNSSQLLLLDMTSSFADSITDGIAASYGYLRVVGNVTPRLAINPVLTPGSVVARHGIATRGGAQSATKYVLPSPSLKTASTSSLDLVTIDFADTNRWQPCPLGESTAIGGSPPSYYDGSRVAEIGFFERPEITAITTAAGPNTGVYNYVCVYEQTDARGQWHQSNISDPFPVTLNAGGGSGAAVIVAYTLQATNRSEISSTLGSFLGAPFQIRTVFYRTQANGTVFYRVPGGQVINDTSVSTQSFTDGIADTALGAPLYTQPGLSNVAQVKVTPPSFTSMIVHGDRLVGACGKAVWFTGQFTPGEGYWFADAFQFSVENGGDVTAFASMDGALVIFKRQAIAFVDGQGPADNGTSNDFGPPQFIATDVGCIDPRSVVVTPDGVLFQSLRGIELLTRKRSIAPFFGNNVMDSLDANPVITSAVLNEEEGTVTFYCQPTESSTTGITMTWDMINHIWTTGTLSDGLVDRGAKSAIMWGHNPGTTPILTWMDSSGFVYQESSTTNKDAGRYASMRLVSPWIKMSGLQGYGRTKRVTLLLEVGDPADITVNIRLDNRSAIVQTRTFTAAEVAAQNPPQLQVILAVQKCESVQVEITDASPAGASPSATGQGPILVGLRISYEQKEKARRLPAAAR